MEQLKAGLELDALVAEKVMDEPEPIYVPDWDRVMAATLSDDVLWSAYGNWFWICDGDKNDGVFCYPRPFSTDIAAAWQVVEKMQERGMWAQLRTPFGKGKMDDGFWCGFTPMLTTGWNGRPDHNTSAATMPLSICLAALKAITVDYGTSRTETNR